MVYARIGADETVMGFDDENAVGADDAARLAKDHFDEPGIAGESFRQRFRLRRRTDSRETDGTAFGFRNDFLSDD